MAKQVFVELIPSIDEYGFLVDLEEERSLNLKAEVKKIAEKRASKRSFGRCLRGMRGVHPPLSLKSSM